MTRWGILVAALATAAPAWAADKVLYQPPPDWVAPAPPIDPAKLGDDAPVMVLLDSQQRLNDGQVWSYFDGATRVATAQALGQIGTIQLPWQPAQGDLIIHRAEIIRGAERIDLIKGGDPFTVIRREERLARREMDGMLTATMAVPGLQVGDVLRLSFSTTRTDPTLKGEVQTAAVLLTEPNRISFARSRLVWPAKSDVKWKAYLPGVAATPVTNGAWRELSFAMPLPKAAELPADAPLRYQPFPVVEASSFADWAAVSKVMAPLYATDGLIAPGSPLAAEVAKIMAAESDPLKRTALALQLVQDKVSYLLLGMDTGNYVPQAPARTWDVRYGDCKAKTLLLLAMLHAMKIEAEPVLASVRANAKLNERLPSAAAFDHVFVRAIVNGETLWLDGTDGGARLADIRDTPNLGQVLPVRTAGAGLMPIVLRPAARPAVETEIVLDQSAGIRLPAPFTFRTTVRGASAEALKGGAASGTQDQIDQVANKLVGAYLGEAAVVATRAISADTAAGTATVTATGVAYPEWTRENGKTRYGLDKAVGELNFNPDRARAAWRDLPVRTADPEVNTMTTRIKLPRGGAGFTVDGPDTYDDTLAGRRVVRAITRSGDELVVDERIVEMGAEVAVADISATRQKIAAAKAKLPMAVAPADYPAFVAEVDAARGAKKLAALDALYAKRIADKPDDQGRYADRAWFADRVMDRKAAIADLDRAVALEPSVTLYLQRSRHYSALGQDAAALKDANAALKLDPGSDSAMFRVASLMAEARQGDAALALLQPRIDEGGKDRFDRLGWKAEVQSLGGDYTGAIATLDGAIAEKPGDPSLLNSRCWTKGIGNQLLDTALKDCTKAIELADDPTAALDSRAMVYFRMGRPDDALDDLNAALDKDPDQAGSLYMRGVIRRKQGKTADGDRDLAMARALEPQIDREYKRFGIVP